MSRLRDQIRALVHLRTDLKAARAAARRWETACVNAERERDAAVADRAKLRQHAENLGDVVLPMLRKREADLQIADAATAAWQERAEQAEAERDQLRYERRLLGLARMTLDLVASGDESRWPQARREAEDIAQRIVDEIGHPVTDEPALGPSLRAQLQQAEAVLARSRAALATFEGRGVNNFDIPTPAEIVEAWRASLDQPAQQGDADV